MSGLLNLQESDYFNALPEFIRQNIMQSGIEFINEADLRQFVVVPDSFI